MPLYTAPEQVPDSVDIACVVVGTGVVGGPGAELARILMAQGKHVLQEHPLHADDLGSCLRQARQSQVGYQLNTLYVHLEPVQRFVRAAQRLLARHRPLFIEVTCSVLVSYSLFDILGQVLGRIRPSGLRRRAGRAGGGAGGQRAAVAVSHPGGRAGRRAESPCASRTRWTRPTPTATPTSCIGSRSTPRGEI